MMALEGRHPDVYVSCVWSFSRRYSKIQILIMDTNVLVLAIAAAQRFNIPELRVASGNGKNFLKCQMRCLLLFVLADPWLCPSSTPSPGAMLSSFSGRGKKIWWGHLEDSRECHGSILFPGNCPRLHRPMVCGTRVLCSPAVRPHQQSGSCGRGQKGILHSREGA